MAAFCRKFAYIMAFLLSFQIMPAFSGNLIRDSEIELVLQDSVLNMAREAGFPEGIKIRIIIDPAYNAFVVGGETVFIHSGLLLTARSAEEILGVIAHEIGHLAAGHAPLREEAAREASLATALTAIAAAAVAASGSADAALGVAIGGSDRAKRRYLSLSRKDESVADEWALSLLDSAGISSHGLTDFMRRQASQRILPESRQSEYYTTHPGAKERLSTFTDHTNQTANENRRLSDADIQRLARIVLKLAAYIQPPGRARSTPFRLDWTRASSDPSKVAPANTSLLYAEAIALFRRGDIEASDKVMTDLLTRSSDDAWLQEFAGDLDMSAARPDRAAVHYRQALSLQPDSPQISLSLGRALIAINDNAYLPEAIQALKSANEGEPNWGFVKRQLAIAYGRNGQVAEADLTLAEEALLAGDKPRAAQMANRALADETAAPHIRSRARDILFQLNVEPTKK